MVKDPLQLPDDLPVPEDDGAADHLAGTALPAVTLRATMVAASPQECALARSRHRMRPR